MMFTEAVCSIPALGSRARGRTACIDGTVYFMSMRVDVGGGLAGERECDRRGQKESRQSMPPLDRSECDAATVKESVGLLGLSIETVMGFARAVQLSYDGRRNKR